MKRVFLLCVLFFLSVGVFAAKIDLAVSSSDVTISPSQPKAGDAVSVSVKIHNEGTKASKASIVKLKITKGTTKIFNQKNSIPAIAAGESYDTLFSVGALQEATYTLLIKVDPANAIPETNEGNNKVTLSLVVSGSGSGGGTGKVAANIVANTLFSSFEAVDMLGKGIGGRTEKGSFWVQIGNLLKFMKNPEDTWNCSKSGSMEIDYQLDSTYLRIGQMQFNYNNCEEWVEQSTNTYTRLNGVMTIDLAYLSDNPLSPDFNTVSQITIKTGDGNPSNDTLPDYSVSYYENGSLYDTISSDYTLTVNIFGYSDDGMPTDMGIYINGSMALASSSNSINYIMTFDNLHYDTSISGTENDMTVSIIIAGTSSCVYDNNQSKKITVTYNNVNISSHSTTTYEEETIDGLMDVQSPCFSGSISIETLQPIVSADDADCPNGGKLKVTAGGKSATVTFNSDGSISIDENSDGSVDYTLQNCNDTFGYPC